MVRKLFKFRKILILGLSAIFIFGCEKNQNIQDNPDNSKKYYYWSANKKVYVDLAEWSYIIKLDEGVSMEGISDQLSVNVYPYVENLATLSKKQLTLSELKSTKGINNAIYRFRIGTTPFDLTGEILLQPKQGIEIEKLLKIIDNRAVIKEKTKYNTFVLSTDDWDKIFDYANKLYESKLVEYSHPNFWTSIALL